MLKLKRRAPRGGALGICGGLVVAVVLTSGLTDASASRLCASSVTEHPEGRIVYAGRENNGRDFEIYVMNGDGADQKRLTFNDDDDIRPDWSPGGSQIVWVRDERGDQDSLDRNLYLMCADGSNKRKRAFLDDRPWYQYLNTRGSNEDYPAWKPTGGWIAFEWDPANDGSDVRVMRPSRPNNYTIVAQQENTFNSDPAWAPDGDRIAFIEDQDVLALSGTDGCCEEPERIVTSDGLLNPAWSPDGSEIMFSAGSMGTYDDDMPGGNMDIYLVDPAGGTPVPLVVDSGSSVGGDWSPDGARIVFYSGVLSSWHIWAVNRDGTGLTQLTTSEGAEINPSWTR